MGRVKAKKRPAVERAAMAGAAVSAAGKGKPAPAIRFARAAPAKSEPARQAVQEHVDATPERIAHANDGWAIVDAEIDKAGEKARLTRRFADSWPDRLYAKGQLTFAQRFACGWYQEVHASAFSAPRVTADYGEGAGGAGAQSYGAPRSESQATARQLLRRVRDLVSAGPLSLFEMVVIEDAMPAFANGQQRSRFAAHVSRIAQMIAEHIHAPGVDAQSVSA